VFRLRDAVRFEFSKRMTVNVKKGKLGACKSLAFPSYMICSA